MPGPDPNPNARRRNARVGPIVLPSEGRRGRAPKWPLPANPRLTARINLLQDAVDELEERELADGKLSRTDRTALTRKTEALAIAREERSVIEATEKELWSELWKTPQAVEWERLRWTREVAQYARWKAQAEAGDLDAGKESRQYADRLGLSPKGLRALMWTIAVDQVKEKRDERGRQAATGTDGGARAPRRFKVVATDETKE